MILDKLPPIKRLQYWVNIINDALQFINKDPKMEAEIIRLDASITGMQFKDIVTNAANPTKPNERPSLFGNQTLNHFNVILDNQNGYIYLKPNSRVKESYYNYESYQKEISN